MLYPDKSPPTMEQKCVVLRKGDLQDIYGDLSRRLFTIRNEQTTLIIHARWLNSWACYSLVNRARKISVISAVSSAKFRCNVFDK